MRYIYTFFLWVILPFILFRLCIRGLKWPIYRPRWQERLGIFKPPQLRKKVLWVHAVSVGEVVAASPMVKRLIERHPGYSIVMTTMTPTGSDRVKALLGGNVFHVYCPYDLPLFINYFLRRLRPNLLVIMETELWPNIVNTLSDKQIPIVLVNGRMSEKSARGYKRFGKLSSRMFNQLNCALVQDEATKNRFIDIGMKRSLIEVTGSIKYDLEIPTEKLEEAHGIKKQMKASGKIIVAASTHSGEDEVMLGAYQALKKQYPDCRLIIVPRHPERFDSVASLAESLKSQAVIRRSSSELYEHWDIMVGDTMGEMFFYFALSDIVIMGGSFINRGGHNFLEPAALGLPLISGPFVFNFEEISDKLRAVDALKIVNDEAQLVADLARLCNDEAYAHRRGHAAKQLVSSNKGAIEKNVDALSAYFSKA